MATPTLKVEVAFNGDPFPTYSNQVLGVASAYWRLGEASGNFLDSSGGGHTATVHNSFTYNQTGALAPEDTNGAAIFGATAYATTAYTPTATQMAFGFSFECWFKRASAPAALAVIGANDVFQLDIQTNGKASFTYTDSNTFITTATSTGSVCDGNYHHIVGVWNTAEVWLFLDGVQTGTALVATGTPASAAIGMSLGATNTGTSPIAATLDECAFYLDGLTPYQIQNHYIGRFVNNAPTWTDITADVVDCQITYGEQWERNQTETGTATLTLDNVAGNYDPANTNSPYYSDPVSGAYNANMLIPMRMIRISANLSGTQYWMFNGFVERWPAVWESPDYASVQITCVDGFAYLSNMAVDGYIIQGKSGAQIASALQIVAWPGGTSIGTGANTLAAQLFWPYSGSSDTDTLGLDFIQQCAQSEKGTFFIQPSSSLCGTATFQDGNYRKTNSRSTSSQGSWGDSPTESQSMYTGLAPSVDIDRLINDARITLSDGSTVESGVDTTSIRHYFRRSYTLDTQLVNSSDATTYVSYLLNNYAEPGTRFDSVTIEPLNNSTMWTQAFTTLISDRNTVFRRAPGYTGQLQWDVFVEQIQWIIPSFGEPWQFILTTSPAF
jgi:hypothetical protein